MLLCILILTGDNLFFNEDKVVCLQGGEMKAYRVTRMQTFPSLLFTNARVFGGFVQSILKNTCQVDSNFPIS